MLDTDRQTPPSAPSSTQLSRDQILAATSKVLQDAGYDATTIRRIAKELDCAVGSIYRYFRDKRELLYAVTQKLLEPAAMMAESDVAIDSSIRLYLQQASASPQMYRLMFWLASFNITTRSLSERVRLGPKPSDDKPGSMPDVVWRIIRAWSLKLGNLPAAQKKWAQVHGSVLLGCGLDLAPQETVEHIDPAMRHAAIVASLSPLPTPAGQGDHQTAPAMAARGDDVTLL